MELYERLIELRKRNNLSQEELAEKLDISRQAISKWESNQSNPDIDNIIRLGEIYNVSMDYILCGKEEIQKVEPPNNAASNRRKFHLNGFIWLGLGVVAVIVLYFITNHF